MSRSVSLKGTEELQNAFEAVNLKLKSSPVLAFPAFQKKFSAETDTSATATEENFPENQEARKPYCIDYAIRTINVAENMFSTSLRKDLAVILSAFVKWCLTFIHSSTEVKYHCTLLEYSQFQSHSYWPRS